MAETKPTATASIKATPFRQKKVVTPSHGLLLLFVLSPAIVSGVLFLVTLTHLKLRTLRVASGPNIKIQKRP